MKNNNASKVLNKKPASKTSLSSLPKKTGRNYKNNIAFKSSPSVKALQSLNEKNEEKYRDIIENIQEGIFEVDLDGHFTFLNNSVCRALGNDRENLIGINSKQFTDKNDAKKVTEAYKKVYKTGKPVRGTGLVYYSKKRRIKDTLKALYTRVKIHQANP